MRKSYIESYYSIIPKIQQDRLLQILKTKYDDAGVSPDDKTLQNKLEELVAELKNPLGNPLIQLRKAEKYSKVSSVDYNNTMEEAYVDLGALFKQNNTINRTIKTHKLINDATLRDVRSALRKVENDIMVYKVIKENKTGITDAKFNTFYKDDNQAEDGPYKAWIDTDTNSLKLPFGMDNSTLSINGLAAAEISISRYGGGIMGTLETEEHRKEKAIDESMQTFWGEVILTDEPIRQIYNGNLEFGTICEVTIRLFRTEPINHIKILPFTNYPLRIFKIEYREAIADSWSELDITEQTSVSAIEFNFTEIYAKEIRIVINQKNPSINTYNIPKYIVNNAQMWQQIVDREYSLSTSTNAPIQATQDMIDYITGFRAYTDEIEKYKEKTKELGKTEDSAGSSMSKTIFKATTQEMTKASKVGAEELSMDILREKDDPDKELIEVRKYEYLYGAYNIDIKHIWYLERGEYVSPQYKANGAILETRLDAVEVLPSGASIEYQVATRKDEWKNILPSGHYITKERVDIDPLTRVGILRFPAESSPVGMYRNDEDMPAVDWTYSSSDGSVAVASGWYNASASYTISYQPKGTSDVTPSGVVVSFANDSLIETEETFTDNSTRQYKIELSHYPYIDYDVINDTAQAGKSGPGFSYEAGRWLNVSGFNKFDIEYGSYYDMFTITVDGHAAENRTDYYNDIRPALTSYNAASYPNFEYFHSGNNVYFNTPLDGREIKIIYKYLNDYIQLKALLRNNIRKNISETPICKDYTLKLRTI